MEFTSVRLVKDDSVPSPHRAGAILCVGQKWCCLVLVSNSGRVHDETKDFWLHHMPTQVTLPNKARVLITGLDPSQRYECQFDLATVYGLDVG